ncbi:hypothetical protein JCGZ_19046 [Jatropha curcas]|uniref:Uncharacterized protein n=1 Tax=Jatropha curcas TaxID=180498 RepID=A0A067JVG3_JATCU|nr:hypothetical protein JCGZ_19046 [Jatropha curcas]
MVKVRHELLRVNLEAKLMHNDINKATIYAASSGGGLLAGFQLGAESHFITVASS